MDKFILHSAYKPTGDQPQAIERLVESINSGNKEQVLLGVTGSGKTFTMANIIERVNRPTLVLAHNKTHGVYVGFVSNSIQKTYQIKCTKNAMCLNHFETIPSTQAHEKIVFVKCPWCQKGWGPL